MMALTPTHAHDCEGIEGVATVPHETECRLRSAVERLKEDMEQTRRTILEIEQELDRERRGEARRTPGQDMETRRREAEAELERIEAGKRKAEAERRRIEAQKKKAEAERRRIEEAKRKTEAERKRIEAAKKKAEAKRRRMDQARRREAERALQEQTARDAQELEKERLALVDTGRLDYIAQIKDKIERNWLRPPGSAAGLKCAMRVSQLPGGEVVQAKIQTSSGNVAFDRSVLEAGLRSSPLPTPKDPSLFDRHIVITFEPDAHRESRNRRKERRKALEALVVTLDGNGKYSVNHGETRGSPMSASRLESLLRMTLRHRPGVGVVVEENEHASAHEAQTLMGVLQRAGFPNIPSFDDWLQRLEYIAQIKDKIERNWLRPPGTAAGLKCVVRVSQIQGGEVVQAEIRTSSGNIAFDRSVEEAVLRSSPLPIPKDPSLFDRNIVITFEPEA